MYQKKRLMVTAVAVVCILLVLGFSGIVIWKYRSDLSARFLRNEGASAGKSAVSVNLEIPETVAQEETATAIKTEDGADAVQLRSEDAAQREDYDTPPIGTEPETAAEAEPQATEDDTPPAGVDVETQPVFGSEAESRDSVGGEQPPQDGNAGDQSPGVADAGGNASGTGTASPSQDSTLVTSPQGSADPVPPGVSSGSVEQVISSYRAQLEATGSSFLGQVNALAQQAVSEYNALPEENRTQRRKDAIVYSKVEAIRELEKSCDASVEGLLTSLAAELGALGADTQILESLRAEYVSRKAAVQASYESLY